jgi:nucleotide-binding universal stress UspA family protein
MPAYQNVVVEVDDSQAGARVVAGLQAGETGGKLILVTAYRARGGSAPREASPLQAAGSGPAELTLKRAEQTCADMGADSVETLALAGDPATVLTEAERDHGADLLMVGHHGLSTLGRRLVGSVPGQVIGKASCDVLIAHTTTLTDRLAMFEDRDSLRQPP